MSHFSLEQWTNFVRGLSPEADRAEMGRHLATGCPVCEKLHSTAELVRASAHWAKTHEPPEHVLRRALDVFALQPESRASDWPLLPIQLLFDSLLTPQPVGLRSSGVLHRETMHQAGGLTLTLRAEREAGTAILSVVGQIAGAEEELTHLPVLLWQGNKLVARTLTGATGEFHMDAAGKSPLRLMVVLEKRAQRIEVPLEV